MKKSFYSWLQQFKADETPLGDFARDTKADKDFPHQATSYKHIHDYLESKRACAEVLDIFNESYEQYKKTNETKATELTPTLEYKSWISELKTRYKQAQIKASVAVNGELLKFYFELGKDISEKQFANSYGSAFYKILSSDLIVEFPDAKGFSPTNLKYSFYFYDLYKEEVQNRQQLVDDLCRIPWGHHVQIIGKCKNDSKKALFYVEQIIQNNWSRNVLLNFIDSNLYERQGKAVTNFSQKLSVPAGDLAQQITKDPYSFDFLSLRTDYDEKELKDALIGNIEKFLLELGKGFAYMGREYRLEVGSTEQFLDMLFYNTNLRCYIVIEVKTGKFEPSFIGQLGTYVAAVNHILKTEHDNPTLGILICKDKDNILAKYSLESSAEPLAVSEYELAKLYPVDFKSSLPTIEEIESELGEIK